MKGYMVFYIPAISELLGVFMTLLNLYIIILDLGW